MNSGKVASKDTSQEVVSVDENSDVGEATRSYKEGEDPTQKARDARANKITKFRIRINSTKTIITTIIYLL